MTDEKPIPTFAIEGNKRLQLAAGRRAEVAKYSSSIAAAILAFVLLLLKDASAEWIITKWLLIVSALCMLGLTAIGTLNFLSLKNIETHEDAELVAGRVRRPDEPAYVAGIVRYMRVRVVLEKVFTPVLVFSFFAVTVSVLLHLAKLVVDP